jgi:hypothetical protein
MKLQDSEINEIIYELGAGGQAGVEGDKVKIAPRLENGRAKYYLMQKTYAGYFPIGDNISFDSLEEAKEFAIKFKDMTREKKKRVGDFYVAPYLTPLGDKKYAVFKRFLFKMYAIKDGMNFQYFKEAENHAINLSKSLKPQIIQKGGEAGSDFWSYYANYGAIITGGSYFNEPSIKDMTYDEAFNLFAPHLEKKNIARYELKPNQEIAKGGVADKKKISYTGFSLKDFWSNPENKNKTLYFAQYGIGDKDTAGTAPVWEMSKQNYEAYKAHQSRRDVMGRGLLFKDAMEMAKTHARKDGDGIYIDMKGSFEKGGKAGDVKDFKQLSLTENLRHKNLNYIQHALKITNKKNERIGVVIDISKRIFTGKTRLIIEYPQNQIEAEKETVRRGDIKLTERDINNLSSNRSTNISGEEFTTGGVFGMNGEYEIEYDRNAEFKIPELAVNLGMNRYKMDGAF